MLLVFVNTILTFLWNVCSYSALQVAFSWAFWVMSVIDLGLVFAFDCFHDILLVYSIKYVY